MEDIRNMFMLTKDDLEKIVSKTLEEMENGLQGRASTLQMIPTYAPIPTGNETGKFIGIDIGGTNMRIIYLDLPSPGVRGELQTIESVMPKNSHTNDEFFGYIANKLKSFVYTHKLENESIKAGLTFSFAVNQEAINKGELVGWSKGWDIKEAIGKDVVKLITEQMIKIDLKNVEIVALINDTVGTLINLAYDDPSCGMGIIFGTGTNGCYIEKTSNICAQKMRSVCKEEFIVINTEWGGLDFKEFKRNKFDLMIGEVSVNKGSQKYEKLISGIYLGWLSRLVIRELMQKKVCFERYLEKEVFLDEPDDTHFDESRKFFSRHTEITEDTTENLSRVHVILEKLGVTDSTLEERKILKEVCTLVVKRSGYLASAVTVALYRKMSSYLFFRSTAGIDGTVYQKSVPFKKYYIEGLDLLQPQDKIMCQLSKDGFGLGAVIFAAAVSWKQ
uniref:Phosphotransferase n=1 Tax=Entamoeba invadens TaxID=33085 RepID=S0B0E1_ENTIV|nr:hexokinase, putative [Entamoeba invadens]